MGLNINLNFDFDDLKLDKLYEDANKSGAADLSSNQRDVTSTYQTSSANSYGGTSSSQTETLDMTVDVETSKNADVSMNATPTTDSSSVSNNVNQTSSGIDINATSSNTTSGANNSISNSQYSSSNTNTDSLDISSVGTSDSSNNSNSDSGNSSFDVDTDIEFDSNSNTNSNNSSVTGSNGSIGANSSQTTGGTNSSSTDINIDVDIDIDTEQNEASTNQVEVRDDKIIFTSIDTNGQKIITEIAIDDYVGILESFGIGEVDINRVLNGEISVEALFEEIEKDPDTTRMQAMMQASYLKACGLDFANMNELVEEINKLTIEIEKLTKEKERIESKEIDDILQIIERLKKGDNLDDILSKIVMWQYYDAKGNLCYRYDNPYLSVDNPANITTSYVPVTFEMLYGDSEYLKKLREVLNTEIDKPFLFGDEKTIYVWKGTDEQNKFLDNLLKEYEDIKRKRQTDLSELNKQISELQQQLATNKYLHDYIVNEVSHYVNNIQKYISKDDFYTNNKFNPDCKDTINKIRINYDNVPSFNNQQITQIRYINDRDDVVDVISCMINGEDGLFSNFFVAEGGITVKLLSDDDMIDNYSKWSSIMTTQEIEIFNYILNTEGHDGAYKYLENIANTLDNRWLEQKIKEDQEFAEKNPFLASVASIIVTPIEGISAACNSMNAFLKNQEIRRADVYSAGNIWREQIAQSIAEDYGNGWAFAYNTGMSMADSVSLIGLNVATGGTLSPVLSVGIMGSRAYVSTLNDALDRGISDGPAILLAVSSAVIESAMENYSLGHLMNLEKSLGKNTIKWAGKIADNISNETVANVVTKGFYVGATVLSQAFCEGEEEFATEILNYVADMFIAQDLSNYATTIEYYLSQGYSEDEALLATMKDFSSQAFQAYLGGFVSGVCFGSFGGVTSTIRTSQNIANQMYSDLEGLTKAQQFAKALEINEAKKEVYEDILEEIKQTQIKDKIDPVYGFQIDRNDFGNGWINKQVENGFFTKEKVDDMLNTVNQKGYISEETGKYLSELFSSNSTIYIKTINQTNLQSILQEGVRCLGNTTSGQGLIPTNIYDIDIGNTVTEVEGMYDLISLIKSSNGISQGGNPTDGTLIIKIPKEMKIEDIYNFSESSNTFCIKPEFIDCFCSVDVNGKVSEPIFGDTIKNNIEKILDEMVAKIGETKARRALIMYNATKNTRHIPVEFREKIQNITSTEIDDYFGREKFDVGIQFFGNRPNIEIGLQSIISNHDQKYGYGDAIRRLLEFTNPQSNHYQNYDLISNNLGAKRLLRQYTAIEIKEELTRLGYDIGNVPVDNSILNNINNKIINPIDYMSSIFEQQISNNLKSIVSSFVEGIKNNQNLYNVLITLNSVKKSIPSQQDYERYINRFSENNYVVMNQDNCFIHVQTYGFNSSNVEHRLYINAEFNDTYKFLELFANKCEELNLEFYFKTTYMRFNTQEVAPSVALTRTESAVIYADANTIAKYTEICRQIKTEHPEINFYLPTISTSVVDGWLGYGMEPLKLAEQKLGKQQSYNTLRAYILEQAIKKGITDFIDINGEYSQQENWTINDLYIYELYDYIRKQFNLDENSLYNHLFKYKEYYINALKEGKGFRIENIDVYASSITTIKMNLYSNYLSNINVIYDYIQAAIASISPEYGVDPNNFAINIS